MKLKLQNLLMDIRIFIRLHELIQTAQTGTPKDLAHKLGFSERSLHYYISFMKKEMNAPIVWDALKNSYVYERPCGLCFRDTL